jgi:hypothetical protein
MMLSKKHRKALNIAMAVISILVVLSMILLYSGLLT